MDEHPLPCRPAKIAHRIACISGRRVLNAILQLQPLALRFSAVEPQVTVNPRLYFQLSHRLGDPDQRGYPRNFSAGR